MTNGQSKNGWEKAEILSKILAALAIPIILLLGGSYFDSILSERAAQAQIVQVAVETLRDRDTPDNLRRWAVDVINAYAPVKLDPGLQQELIQGLTFPDGPAIVETPTP
jgi:hypothetical protein